MQQTIRLGIFQFDVVANNIEQNQHKIGELITHLKVLPDILLLPEMYTTGFIVKPNGLAKEELEKQAKWQAEASVKYKTAIIGSLIIPENGMFYNRLYFTSPDGQVKSYNKRHLFRMSGENEYYQTGNERVLFDYNGIKIMPQVCYDLRFPVWARNNLGYHILVYSANWPDSRNVAWETLLRARAIENQCYTIGINRIGTDTENIHYEGNSQAYGPKGEILIQMDNKERYTEIQLSITELLEFRNKFPAYLDADDFEIKNRE